ncbi:response regulator [Oculatella sp. FACHB-28]|uniref:adenylate/guanylate cyclase domain-containing protein n=1 Tax=Cyanophyceae TaxID=3028117 RepID=UPI001689A909|nr:MULTISPECIES: adenylate/guanylate cyclase domain-containing protein [Cyanophyceae]MBD2058553.1 response regulator [Oculatella sp. FACHB-28]MBD2066559.1 response regulator [Leptolyngbya sp. FACHB-671]
MSNPDSKSAVDLSEGERLSLPPAIAYYIRRLLRRNLDRLQSNLAPESAITVNALSDFDAVIADLYVETEKINTAVLELKALTVSHQTFSLQKSKHRQELLDLEQQIFELLGFEWQETDYQKVILVVDDTPENLHLLSSTLSQQGYDIRGAISGSIALTGIRNIMPDLILLDIMMPGINGYEVCEQIKADTLLQDIPIIFISAVDDALDKVKAFEVGAVDYITKPFQIEEVLARVELQLNTRSLQKRLEEQNVRLQQEIGDRQDAEDKYRSIVENAIDGIFQTSPDGRYLSANPALAKIYGYESPDELVAQISNIGRQLYVLPTRRAEFIAYMQQYGIVSDFESQVYCKDGSVIWISEDARVVKDANDTLLYYEGSVKDVTERRQAEEELRQARRATEQLLLNILPQKIAERLKRGQAQVIADNFAEVTILFADIVNFTPYSAQVPPVQLVRLLNQIFSTFDQLVEQYRLEKVKTVGDAYIAVGGLPQVKPDHAEAIADLALAMQQAIAQFHRDTGDSFCLRIGINTGPVVAGVIGTKKFSYDLWGDTVNVASRMESEGVADKIQVTEVTYNALREKYILKPRGSIRIKGRGEMMTYWLLGKKGESAQS